MDNTIDVPIAKADPTSSVLAVLKLSAIPLVLEIIIAIIDRLSWPGEQSLYGSYVSYAFDVMLFELPFILFSVWLTLLTVRGLYRLKLQNKVMLLLAAAVASALIALFEQWIWSGTYGSDEVSPGINPWYILGRGLIIGYLCYRYFVKREFAGHQ